MSQMDWDKFRNFANEIDLEAVFKAHSAKIPEDYIDKEHALVNLRNVMLLQPISSRQAAAVALMAALSDAVVAQLVTGFQDDVESLSKRVAVLERALIAAGNNVGTEGEGKV